ncbi:MAG: DUF4191 domain-containing protein [Micrococcales bacterium]|nr:DUF4191 domain-containing protein [Micrococcales bacterium]
MARVTPTNLPEPLEEPKGRLATRRAAKAAKKAAKPKKKRWYQQTWEIYKLARTVYPQLWMWLLVAVVVTVAVFAGLGFLMGRVIYMTILGVPFGLVAAMIVLASRGERAAYKRIEDETGAVGAALRQIRKGYFFEEDPIAADPRSRALVYRGVGRAGVFLVGEGPGGGRLEKMVEAETRKVNRVAPDIRVIVFLTGREEGRVPLRKLNKKIQRVKPSISKAEVAVVERRLKALGGVNLPIPKGIDPLKARPDRKALRGR